MASIKSAIFGGSISVTVGLLAIAAIATPNDKAAWKSTMNKLSQAISETVPYLYPDPSHDEKTLATKVRHLYELTKSMDVQTAHGVKLPDDDPVLPFLASAFRQDIERAYISLQDGHAEYGKALLRSSAAYCVACHTRHEAGVEFPLLKAFQKPLQRASWIERLEFQTATRQYDVVLNEVMGQLKSSGKPPGISSLDLERGARMALSLLVRIKKDPDRAALLSAAVAESPSATLSMKEAAKVWRADIREWQSTGKIMPVTTRDTLKEAKRLTEVGGTTHAEVRLLRATVLLHDFLKSKPKDAEAAEALYLAGRAYDRLGEIGMWKLHEFYFVACIDKAPHSQIAESCYQSYHDSMVLGFSGSGGTRVPKEISEHLARLKSKASVKK